MQQHVFGQDTAITILAHELQQSQAHLQQLIKPFCSLLFTGPHHSGKRTVAITLAEQLFKQPNVLYFAQLPTPSLSSIGELKVQCYGDKHCLTLKDLVRQMPHAILLFEQIDQAPSAILEGLQEILSTGHWYDGQGTQYNFRQTIILLSTTLGSCRLVDLAKASAPEEEHSTGLLQLVMNEQQRTTFSPHHYSPQEIAEEITAEISHFLPASLCQYLHVAPFLPLNTGAIEKIIRLKIQWLAQMLDSRYGIKLSCAPEVIRYLSNEMRKKEEIENKAVDKDKALKPLYFVIEQAILNRPDNKNHFKQLFLQLNENGQILRCHWPDHTKEQLGHFSS
jgi:ATP-dependent Clp protease ATP-binding subunit ClpB